MRPKINRRNLALISSLLLLNAIALFPMLTTGYCGDDVLNSQIRGEMIRMHLSLWGVTQHYVSAWVTGQGRFFPLAFYPYTVFYLVRSIFLFKLFVLTVVLASFVGILWFPAKTHRLCAAARRLLAVAASCRSVQGVMGSDSGFLRAVSTADLASVLLASFCS